MHPEPELWENRQPTSQEAFTNVKSPCPITVSVLNLIMKVIYLSTTLPIYPSLRNIMLICLFVFTEREHKC